MHARGVDKVAARPYKWSLSKRKEKKRKDYRTAFNVGRLLIRVVTPRNITHDLLRSLMIKT